MPPALPGTTTLPLAPHLFWPAALLAALLLAALLIHHLLDGLSDTRRSRLWAELRPGWLFLAVVLAILWIGLFALTIAAAFFGLWHAIQPADTNVQPNLGLGALLAALLGAPFVIWGTVLKHQSLRYQKEGHITDRISKAVEQLGAEKKVDRIGRPVTIWFGQADTFSCAEDMAERFLSRPQTTKTNRDWQAKYNPDTDDVEEGYWVTITTYAQSRTIVQWQGEPVQLGDGEVIGSEGEWKVFWDYPEFCALTW